MQPMVTPVPGGVEDGGAPSWTPKASRQQSEPAAQDLVIREKRTIPLLEGHEGYNTAQRHGITPPHVDLCTIDDPAPSLAGSQAAQGRAAAVSKQAITSGHCRRTASDALT